MATTIKLRKDTSAPDIKGTALWTSALVLAGATAKLIMEDAAGATIIDGAVVISDIVEGPDSWSFVWLYDLQVADTATLGVMYPYLEITFADASIEVVPLCEETIFEVVERRCVAQ